MRIGEIELDEEDLKTHVRIMGSSGKGKSTLLYDILTQLVDEDVGFALLDPHGELYLQILSYLAYTEYRKDHVTLLDATQNDVTATINPFVSEPDRIATKAQILTEMTLQAWGRDSEAVRAEKLIRIAFIALLEQNRPLRDLQEILSKGGIDWRTIQDPYARMEWQRLGPKIESVVDAAMTRVATLLNPHLMRFTDPERALNPNRLLRERILLANLSRGRLGRTEARTLGAFLVAEIWSAAFRRRRRHPAFWLICDEFATLASPELASVLAEAQKFGLHVMFLHQTLKQLPNYLQDALGNVSCFIEFDEKGHVQIDGWGSGCQETWFEPQEPFHVGRHDLERYRRETAIAPRLQLKAAPLQLQTKLPGKGGEDHKELQSFIARIGETLGFKATPEKSVPDGQIDVLLERHDLSVACEISVHQTVEYEVKNVMKCLAAGYEQVIVVVENPKKIHALSPKLPGVLVVAQTGFLAALRSIMDRTKPKNQRVYSVEACEILGIDRSTLYRRMRKGLIPYFGPPPYRFDRDVLAKLGENVPSKTTVRLGKLNVDRPKPRKKKQQDERYRKMLKLD